ncbi:MAG: small subunit ribosomal protein [Solirubrobacteraceae bacterium]|jgi:small subunit ribosomal protein S9|nr:small subunit ribosomal protein [Solirubrobacteraceae bacterium]
MTADEDNTESTEPPEGADGAPEGSGAEDAGRAVPTEDAREIASEAEDAPLEALQEAQQAPGGADAPTPPTVEPGGEGHAVPSEQAMEIAGVAEDAALEAAQEADDHAAESAAASEEEEGAGTAPRTKPSVPGAHLEVDIVPEGVDPLGRGESYEDPYAVEEDAETAEVVSDEDQEETLAEPIATAAIDLASGARYRATGKRKTAIARVMLRPGTGTYLINGRPLEVHFPRETLQRNIRQPLETVGYQERMDVVARLHGGGISAQAGALRHGVSRALLEADPNLRGELKRRGFLTRDSRAKERKKAGLKKARKRPQFSKR